MHPFRLVWLLPIVAGAVALWTVLAWPTSEPEDASGGRVATFVAADATGNGHEGIIQGPVAMGYPGHDGKAFSFAEPGSWIMVPSSPALNPGQSDFLVSVWIRNDSNPGPGETYDVVRKGIAYTVPGEFKLELLADGRVRCSAKDRTERLAVVTSKQRLSGNGAWHRIGCARTGESWNVLLDDEVVSTVVDLGAVRNQVALSIGSKYGLEDRPLGLVDDVTFVIAGTSDTPLEAGAAVQELERVPPTAWWRLDEVATTGTGR